MRKDCHKLDHQKDEVIRDYSVGLSLQGIAFEYGVSVSAVYRLLKANKIQLRPQGVHKWNDERRQQHSQTLKGKPSPAKGKTWKLKHIKKSPHTRGASNPQWRGGVTPEHRRIRASPEYKLWREAVFERDNWMCVLCGRRNKAGDKVVIHADHIKPFANFIELRFDVDNGRTLCRECHKQTDTYGVNLRYKR